MWWLWGTIDLHLWSQIELRSPNLPHFEIARTLTYHSFKLGLPNLYQRCILTFSIYLSILGLIELYLQLHFRFWTYIPWDHRWRPIESVWAFDWVLVLSSAERSRSVVMYGINRVFPVYSDLSSATEGPIFIVYEATYIECMFHVLYDLLFTYIIAICVRVKIYYTWCSEFTAHCKSPG